MNKLTGKQQAFINNYLTTFNATLAAKVAGYRATSRHSFESIGSENLRRPAIRSVIDEHFRLSKMGSEQVLIELSNLAKGNSRDKIKALALLSQHHGLLDGRGSLPSEPDEKQRLEIHVKYVQPEINKLIGEVKTDIKQIDEEKDRQWKAVIAKYSHSEVAVEALTFLRDVMASKQPVDTEPDQPKPTEVEIIHPERRLAPPPVERLIRCHRTPRPNHNQRHN
jgi:hypothetical protein